MTLTKWKPSNGLSRFLDEDFPLLRWKPFRDLDRFFDADSPVMALPKFGLDLAADVYEKNGNVVAEMYLPGIDPEKIDISVEENYLKVSGSREEKKETEEKDYYSKEIRRGSFERTIPLPDAVKKDKADASYKDGVLKITIPKDEKKEGTVKVKVTK
ncbi:MAG: Hsp20/alpha crystallin family protein [Candidatus Melainabacteria bacterium]|nr:Hsp20/alpha crystallin family protein [Candidatus Melainabacteria bacterium]